jgi:hypothetical protein
VKEEVMRHIKAIETVYQGNSFRSRLEARWAAFFTEIGWPWTYEPFDCPGWIPDFLISGDRPLLVEIKPLASDFNIEKITGAASRFEWSGEILLLDSSGPSKHDNCSHLTLIGRLGERFREPEGYSWYFGNEGNAVLCRYPVLCESNRARIAKQAGIDTWDRSLRDSSATWDKWPKGQIGVAHGEMSYTDRITGRYDGGHLGGIEFEEAREIWNKATSIVRWNPS